MEEDEDAVSLHVAEKQCIAPAGSDVLCSFTRGGKGGQSLYAHHVQKDWLVYQENFVILVIA